MVIYYTNFFHQFQIKEMTIMEEYKKRIKLLIEIAHTIRKIWPKNRILGARITGTDHMKNGISIQDSKYLVKELEKIGFDYVCV